MYLVQYFFHQKNHKFRKFVNWTGKASPCFLPSITPVALCTMQQITFRGRVDPRWKKYIGFMFGKKRPVVQGPWHNGPTLRQLRDFVVSFSEQVFVQKSHMAKPQSRKIETQPAVKGMDTWRPSGCVSKWRVQHRTSGFLLKSSILHQICGGIIPILRHTHFEDLDWSCLADHLEGTESLYDNRCVYSDAAMHLSGPSSLQKVVFEQGWALSAPLPLGCSR